MVSHQVGRRAALGAFASLAALSVARAQSRPSPASRLRLHVPWPLAAVDPHAEADAAAALFGSALFHSLFANDPSGTLSPLLAEAMPEQVEADVHVRLRAGLVSAAGRRIHSRDVIASLARARNGAARALLSHLPAPRAVDDTTVAFRGADPASLARVLGSPLAAIVPAGFSPTAPDGTGPFRASLSSGALVLSRNPRAANAPSLLDEILVSSAPDLATSLRAFEAGEDDVGWLGSGLHDPRNGAVAFDAGAWGWVVLRTGALAGRWDAPGNAQRVCDGLPYSRFAHLGVGAPWLAQAPRAWGGPSGDLVVRADSPWLVEVARVVASTLSASGRPIGVRTVTARELAELRATRAYVFAVDLVRSAGTDALANLVALAQASDPALGIAAMSHPPRAFDPSPRVLARTLRVGVLGELRARGGRAADVSLPSSDAWGSVDWGRASRHARGRTP